MQEEKKVEERKEKIKKWLKNPYNLGIVLVLLIAFVFRLYFLFHVGDQPLWWDEAEYMATAKKWAFGVPYDINLQRPPLFQLLAAGLLMVGFSEFLIKFMLVLLPSIFLIYTIYLLGKELFNEKIALYSALAASFVWTLLFWTLRFQPDFFSLIFQVLGIFYFWKGRKSYNLKYSLLSGFFIALGFYFKISALLVPIFLLVFAVIQDRQNMFKNKHYWLIFASFIITMIPFFIWSYVSFGSPIAFAPSYASSEQRADRPLGWMALDYFFSFPKTLLFILFILGLANWIFRFSISADIYFKNSEKEASPELLSFIILLVSACFYIFFTKGIIEDRWILIIIPFIMFFASKSLYSIYNYISIKYKKIASIIFLIVVLIIFIYSQIQHTSLLVDSKKDSYLPVKDASLWIKENLEKYSSWLSISYTQATAYSERKVTSYSAFNESSLNTFISTEHPKYLMVSIFEPHPQWIFNWTQNNQARLKAVKVYFTDEKQTNPSLILYEILN